MDKVLDYIVENKILIGLVVILSGFGIYQMAFSKGPSTNVAPAVRMEQPVSKEDVKTTPKKESKKVNKEVAVDIQGAVKVPGVYRLKPNSIVQEAIGRAGGFTDGADTRSINQAQRVTDQMQIIVPKIGESNNNTVTSNVTNSGAEDKQVNINTAQVEDFQKVTGIGPKKAEKIIDYRNQNGNFNNLEDLTKVSGIGDKTLESLRDQLTV
ncbi:helix-hairpin-helix domain-containing protein [Companilactobacillus sp. HBUAS59699]|uniref:helix-hairpin-helix domain-containing protein n=1 Tax=Companilactobacillus sp. HBUAS59699 TaxID=3109358 RepID=UPI002FF42686